VNAAALPPGFINPFCFYPHLRFRRLPPQADKQLKKTCGACSKRKRIAVCSMIIVKKERYDPLNFNLYVDSNPDDEVILHIHITKSMFVSV
jgi:hypothetical protein